MEEMLCAMALKSANGRQTHHTKCGLPVCCEQALKSVGERNTHGGYCCGDLRETARAREVTLRGGVQTALHGIDGGGGDLAARPCAAQEAGGKITNYKLLTGNTGSRLALRVARTVPIGPGGLQSGFSTLRYVRRDFRQKKIGSADSPPPRWPPGPGFLSVARGRAA
jgi:hypothetical protein